MFGYLSNNVKLIYLVLHWNWMRLASMKMLERKPEAMATIDRCAIMAIYTCKKSSHLNMPFNGIKVIIKYNLCVICDRLMGFPFFVRVHFVRWQLYTWLRIEIVWVSHCPSRELVRLHCIVLLHSHNNEQVMRIHLMKMWNWQYAKVKNEMFCHYGQLRCARLDTTYYTDRIIVSTTNREFVVLPAQRLIHNWRCCASPSHCLRLSAEALESVYWNCGLWRAYTHTHTRAQMAEGNNQMGKADNPGFAMLQRHPVVTRRHTHTHTRSQIWKIQRMYHFELNSLLNDRLFFRISGCVCIDAESDVFISQQQFSNGLSVCVCDYNMGCGAKHSVSLMTGTKNQCSNVLANVLSLP